MQKGSPLNRNSVTRAKKAGDKALITEQLLGPDCYPEIEDNHTAEDGKRLTVTLRVPGAPGLGSAAEFSEKPCPHVLTVGRYPQEAGGIGPDSGKRVRLVLAGVFSIFMEQLTAAEETLPVDVSVTRRQTERSQWCDEDTLAFRLRLALAFP